MYDVCKKYKDCWITAPTSANEYEWGLFPYLTENARIYCERLIKHLADALMEKASNDRGTLSIKIIVE